MFLNFLRISASNVLKMFLFKNILFSLKLSWFTFDHSYNILSLFSLAFGYWITEQKSGYLDKYLSDGCPTESKVKVRYPICREIYTFVWRHCGMTRLEVNPAQWPPLPCYMILYYITNFTLGGTTSEESIKILFVYKYFLYAFPLRPLDIERCACLSSVYWKADIPKWISRVCRLLATLSSHLIVKL